MGDKVQVAFDRFAETLTVAREWLRRWAPTRIELAPPDCSCASGRCPLCN